MVRDVRGEVPIIFADIGDTAPPTVANFDEGYELAFEQTAGKKPTREGTNKIYQQLYAMGRDISQFGAALPYSLTIDFLIDAIVTEAGILYICLLANGPSTATKVPGAGGSETFWTIVGETILPAGTIIQTQTFELDAITFSTSSATFVDITGLELAITMTNPANKIVAFSNVCVGNTAGIQGSLRMTRNGTPFSVGGVAGSRPQANSGLWNDSGVAIDTQTVIGSDLPGAGTHTYKTQAQTSSGTLRLNRTSSDTDNTSNARGISTITLMEVKV